MVNIVDHIIDKVTNTKSIKDNTMDMQSIFQPTIYNIGGLGSRLQDCYWMELVCIWETFNKVRSIIFLAYLSSNKTMFIYFKNRLQHIWNVPISPNILVECHSTFFFSFLAFW